MKNLFIIFALSFLLVACKEKDTITSVQPDYKEYVATISQSGTNAPTVNVIKNTFSSAIIWTRANDGYYLGGSLNTFTENKTIVTISSLAEPTQFITGGWSNINNVMIYTKNSSGQLEDGILNNTPIEIRVYN